MLTNGAHVQRAYANKPLALRRSTGQWGVSYLVATKKRHRHFIPGDELGAVIKVFSDEVWVETKDLGRLFVSALDCEVR